jgi:hypothetical protein
MLMLTLLAVAGVAVMMMKMMLVMKKGPTARSKQLLTLTQRCCR